MTERKPVKGEVWTYGNTTWECIDDTPDRCGYCGWVNDVGAKFYADHQRANPPKPERPDQAKGWRAVWSYGMGGYAWDSADDIHRDRDSDYLGALNLETGEWVPRP